LYKGRAKAKGKDRVKEKANANYRRYVFNEFEDANVNLRKV
jgi:hypothetical protein